MKMEKPSNILKPISVEVTVTCERCGATATGEASVESMDDYHPKVQGYCYAELKPLFFKKDPDCGSYVTTLHISGKPEEVYKLLCFRCLEEWDDMLEKLVHDFNEKVKGFLENKEE